MGLIDRPDADPVEDHAGFRAMVEGLLEANLERVPARTTLIRHHEASTLVATDAGVAVTIRMQPGDGRVSGRVLVVDGADPDAEIVVRAESMALLELAAVPLRFGLPDVLTSGGRRMLAAIVRRRIRIRGLLRHLGTVRRLSVLLSVR